jgi:hypothetical protein
MARRDALKAGAIMVMAGTAVGTSQAAAASAARWIAPDLVVLDADPLAGIRNSTRIHTVVTRGRVISTEQRARMLAKIESAAAA